MHSKLRYVATWGREAGDHVLFLGNVSGFYAAKTTQVHINKSRYRIWQNKHTHKYTHTHLFQQLIQ